MLYREIATTGFNASVICLGTGPFGGGPSWSSGDDQNAIKIVHASLDNGVNLIDTAPVYSYGRCEQIVGKAIKGRRDKVIVLTKCGTVWNKNAGEFLQNVEEELTDFQSNRIKTLHKCLTPDSIAEEIEKSLARLGTDYIDLYLTHWQDRTTPIEDTVGVLSKLKEQGKIRAFGVSNASLEQLKQYGDIAAAEEQFNMLNRDVETNGILKCCSQNNIAFLAYSPLCGGLLTGAMEPSGQENPNLLFKPANIKLINAMLEEFLPIAEAHNATPIQVVTVWTFSRPGVTHVLRGAITEEQAIENAFAGDMSLSPDELKTIDAILEKYTAMLS